MSSINHLLPALLVHTLDHRVVAAVVVVVKERVITLTHSLITRAAAMGEPETLKLFLSLVAIPALPCRPIGEGR
jgi:hypothetical protein